MGLRNPESSDVQPVQPGGTAACRAGLLRKAADMLSAVGALPFRRFCFEYLCFTEALAIFCSYQKLYEMKYFCERLEESHSLTDSTYIVPGKPRFGSVNALDVGRVYKMENTKK